MNLKAILLAFSMSLLVGACTPHKFGDGAITTPPWGCIEGRTRGVNCYHN